MAKSTKKTAAKKAAGKKIAAKKTTAKKAAAKKAVAKKSAAKRTTAKKVTAKKTAPKKAASKKAAAKKLAAKKSVAKKTVAKKAPAKKAQPQKVSAKRSLTSKASVAKTGASKTSGVRKSAVGKSPSSKSAAKTKAVAQKTTTKKAVSAKANPARAGAAKPSVKAGKSNVSARKAVGAKSAASKPAISKPAASNAAARKPAASKLAPAKAAKPARALPAASAPTTLPAAAASPKPRAAAKRPAAKSPSDAANPLLQLWSRGPLDLPPFEAIRTEHFAEALREGMARHKIEMEAIAADPEAPTFENTIVAIERSGALLNQVGAVFWNLTGSNADDALQALEREFAPLVAAHYTAISLDPRLFQRIETLWETRESLGLDAQQARVLERHYVELVRSGARLDAAAKARVGEISERLATLTSTFMQNVMKDEQTWRLVLDDEADLAGLPEALRASARRAAQDAGLPDKWVITLARSSVEGFVTFSSRRDLREKAFAAWIARGANPGPTDNAPVLAEVVALRGEYARLMGYDTFAAYSLEDTMAKTPQAVDDLLSRVWTVALERAGEETQAFAEQARADGENHPVEAWDNRYYAEKVRKARYDFDQSVLRPYLALDAMIAAAFYTANRLFGLSFEEIKDAPRYHPDARVWAVKGQGGEAVGAFIGDYFARPGKRSGAWMSSFRSQQRLDGDVRPIIVNVMNFARGAEGQPTLLSLDDARTLFHEFGHALHGMLSNVVYPSISGTSVSRDFVELPSQLYEHWLTTPEILERFARHVETGEAIPAELVEKMKAAKNFNQGHATVEFTSSAQVDMALYSQPAGVEIDPLAFEAQTLAKLGMPKTITMRHRLPHFMHIVGGYAAGYYSYMWSEVMDADAFAAFEETGDVFDPQTAERLRQHIYSAGNSRDPQELWMSFRGRAPSVEGLLKNRGFA